MQCVENKHGGQNSAHVCLLFFTVSERRHEVSRHTTVVCNNSDVVRVHKIDKNTHQMYTTPTYMCVLHYHYCYSATIVFLLKQKRISCALPLSWCASWHAAWKLSLNNFVCSGFCGGVPEKTSGPGRGGGEYTENLVRNLTCSRAETGQLHGVLNTLQASTEPKIAMQICIRKHVFVEHRQSQIL